jgi:DNA polymerase III sliding clamp (beta) subunit (PCNA family)
MQVPQSTLLEIVRRLGRVAKSNSIRPACSSILVKRDTEGVHFTATDLDRWLTISIPSTKPRTTIARKLAQMALARETAAFLLPSDLFAQAVKSADKGSIVELTATHLGITCDGMAATIPVAGGISAAAFDAEPSVTSLSPSVAADSFVKAVSLGINCVSEDDTRHNLRGMLWSDDGNAVATDGRRLFLHRNITPVQRDIIVPKETCRLLEEGMTIQLDSRENGATGGSAIFEKKGSLTIRLVSKLLDAHFPKWSQVIPEQGKSVVRFDSEAVRSLLAKFTPKGRDTKGQSVRLSFRPGEVKFTFSSGGAEFSSPAVVKGDVKTIAFDPRYLTDAVANRCGTLTLIGETYPGVFTSAIHPDILTILMPMRVDGTTQPKKEKEEVAA